MRQHRGLVLRGVTAVVWTCAASGIAAAATAVWDGGNGAWLDAKWNGGKDPFTVFGRENGVRFDPTNTFANSFEIGGGAEVKYIADGVVYKDFLLNPNAESGGGIGPVSGVIKQGAVLELQTLNLGEDYWTEWDGDLTLDGGTLKRTNGGGGTSGAVLFGSWQTGDTPNHQIDVTITNGGRIENTGFLLFGCWNDPAPGLSVHMTIDNGSIDLTGGDVYTLNDSSSQNADLHFFYGTVNDTGVPKGESYVINFTGPGTLTVDRAGIRVHNIGANFETWVDEAKTYEDLWAMGILRANGESGLTGASFGNFFNVSGTLGQDDYTLTSLVGGSAPGDFNGDGKVTGADLMLWQAGFGGTYDGADLADWEANFGESAPALGAVPEPSALVLALLLAVGGATRRRASR